MFSIVKDLKQGTPEWLEFRRKKISATDAGKILKAAKFARWNPYDLWIDKVIGREADLNPAMLKGMELEPFARSAYQDITDTEIVPHIILSDERPYLIASLDGINRGLSRAVEFKCSEKTWRMAKEGKIPDYYIPQLQHTLNVLGHESMDYCAYYYNELIKLTVYRDQDYINALVQKEKAFYDCLVNFVEPERDIEIVDTEEARSYKVQLDGVNRQIKELEEQKVKLREELIRIANDRTIRIDDMQVTKVFKKGIVNYKSIPAIKNVDLEQYRGPSSENYLFIKVRT